MNARLLLALLVLPVVVASCSKAPEDTWARARQARRDADTATYLACFTAHTQKVLANLQAFEDSTRKRFPWLKDPFALLPDDDPTQPAHVDGNVARLRVGTGKRELEAVLVREGGEWRIEGLELPTFWAPLAASKEPE